jgi:hypothetical protein
MSDPVTAPTVRWLGNSDIIRQILAADPNAPKPQFSLGPPATLPARPGEPIARYRSLAQFQADWTTLGALDNTYEWVLYDPENWDDTPLEEQQDPWTWLPRFGQYAHARGYRVIAAPARDLGNVANSAAPKKPGESLSLWYLGTQLAFSAALHSDIVSIQSQADTLDIKAYQHLVEEARGEAKLANPYVKVFAGVSTRYGTPAQMAAAAKSVHVDGFWLNVPGPDPDIGKAIEFLHLMTGGGA